MKHRLGLTPGTPRFVVMKLTDHQDKLGTKEYATYRIGVGTLLHLTKHSRPDLCNPVRELLKTLDKPAPIHFKNVQNHQIYVVATKRQELRCFPQWHRTCQLVVYSESDYVGYKETRISVYFYFLVFFVDYLLHGEAKSHEV